jgi:hypothetical protein
LPCVVLRQRGQNSDSDLLFHNSLIIEMKTLVKTFQCYLNYFDITQCVVSRVRSADRVVGADHVVVERVLLANALGVRAARDDRHDGAMHRDDVHDAQATWIAD